MKTRKCKTCGTIYPINDVCPKCRTSDPDMAKEEFYLKYGIYCPY